MLSGDEVSIWIDEKNLKLEEVIVAKYCEGV